MTDCANCGAHLHGPYCDQCGQHVVHANLTVHDLAHEALHEFVHLDGKIFQTLKLLILKPGALTVEYFRGRRVRYISPVRLFLTFSVLFFAVSAFGSSAARLKVTDADVPTEQVAETIRQVEEANERLTETFSHNGPKAMFALMPIFALLTWSLYRRSERYYVPHLYYSFHFHAFVFLVYAVAKILEHGGKAGDVAGGILSLTVVPYHYIGLRRVFGGSRLQTFWKATTIMVVYTLVVALAYLAIILIEISAIKSGVRSHLS